MKKILAFAASNSSTSINGKLIKYAEDFLKEKHEVTIIDINDFEMPIFSVDRKANDGVPDLANKLSQLIAESDGVLISFAEHNGAYSAAFKNIFDWISMIPKQKAWHDKDMVLMATSPGARGGKTVLEIAENRFPFNGGNVLGTFSLPSFEDNFSPEKGILDDDLKADFLKALELF